MNLAFIKDFGIGGIVRAWTQVTALAIVIVAGRVLTKDEFGIYAVAAVFTTLISTVLYSGLYEFIIKSDDSDAVADTCFWLNMLIALAGAILMTVAAPLTAQAVGAPQLLPVILLLAPSCFIPAFTSWQEGLVLRRGRISVYYVVWFCAETVSAALTVLMFYRGYRIEALIGYRYCLGLVSAAGYFVHSPRLPRLTFDRDAARSAWAFASQLFGSRMIGIIGNYGADLIIGIFAGPAQAGAYRIANRIVFGIGEIWLQPIKTIAWVRFSAASREGSSFGPEWMSLMAILSLVAWPALAGVAVLSVPFTEALLGSDWIAAAPVVTILALAKMFQVFEAFLDPILTLPGRAKSLLKLRSAAAVVAIVGVVFVAHWGANPAAWVQFVVVGLLGGATVAFGLTLTRLATAALFASLAPGLLTTLATAAAAAASDHALGEMQWSVIARLAIDILCGVVAWSVVMMVFFRRQAWGAIIALRKPRAAQASD